MSATKSKTYFVTNKWHLVGIVEVACVPWGAANRVANYTLNPARREQFSGVVGYSAFETREAAVQAVKKKAAAKLRELQRRIAVLKRVIAEGPDAVFAPLPTEAQP